MLVRPCLVRSGGREDGEERECVFVGVESVEQQLEFCHVCLSPYPCL